MSTKTEQPWQSCCFVLQVYGNEVSNKCYKWPCMCIIISIVIIIIIIIIKCTVLVDVQLHFNLTVPSLCLLLYEWSTWNQLIIKERKGDWGENKYTADSLKHSLRGFYSSPIVFPQHVLECWVLFCFSLVCYFSLGLETGVAAHFVFGSVASPSLLLYGMDRHSLSVCFLCSMSYLLLTKLALLFFLVSQRPWLPSTRFSSQLSLYLCRGHNIWHYNISLL